MTIEIKLSTLLIMLLTLPIFPVWGCMYFESKGRDGLCTLFGILTFLAVIVYAFAAIPTTSVDSATPQIQTEHGIVQDVTLQHRSLLPIMPYSWDYKQNYRRVTRENGEHIWINLDTKETDANSEWDGKLHSHNAETLDSEMVDIYINN